MGAIGTEDLMNWEEKFQGMGNGEEEKIMVLVRLRPLNEKEISRNEVADWECINSTTILYRNSLQERSGLPTAYSFDRVFRGDCSTREVYDEGTKEIALSVVGGINSTIFAYGQTSSGKTYTMNGITEYTVADIYDYIHKHEEREFVLKFSAMEIYNEVVKDLLGTENNQLRILDDPEKGTVIEKLTEETLRDWNHLKELLYICEAHRQIGETLLNEISSRSHQILRLTIESSAREFLGKGNSTTLSASINFVDLAGSERASQALSVGQRLKEGCHINRSLLTLGTVIRKLSKGRHGHINYRDSKLTRILQPALGGNARTAIICTLTPARSHVEQSRNTLLFASCAKEVSTNAQVNVVMSDKALVKQLQKELARLESELRTPGSMCDHVALLRKKDVQIEKLEKEIRELKKQQDLAQHRIEELLRTVGDNEDSQKLNGIQSVHEEFRSTEMSNLDLSERNEVHYLSNELSDPHERKEEPLIRTGEDSDGTPKVVRCMGMDESDQDEAYNRFFLSSSDSIERTPNVTLLRNVNVVEQEPRATSPDQIDDTKNGHSHGLVEHRFQDMKKTIDSLVTPYLHSLSPGPQSTSLSGSGRSKLSPNRSCKAKVTTDLPNLEMSEETENTPPTVLDENFLGRQEGILLRKQWNLPPVLYSSNNVPLSRNGSQSSDHSSFTDETKNQSLTQGDEDIPTLGSFVAGLKKMAKLRRENHTEDQVHDTEKTDEKNVPNASSEPVDGWPLKFEKLQKLIIELWQACNVSLIHRTYFILLIKDDIADSIYMEVEHRRLSFLRDTFARGNSAVHDGRTLTLSSSKKALHRERKMLSRLMSKWYTEDERRRLYNEWGINVNAKQRRLQLVRLLWSDTENMDHITKSASIVANLIGFSEHGQALKEMFGLSFAPLRMTRKSFRWKNSMSSLL